MQKSLELLDTGSAEAFISSLVSEIKGHSALSHDYLASLSSGKLDTNNALKDYAYNYSNYSRLFPNYCEAVLSSTSNESYRSVIIENLQEEEGDPDSPVLEKQPHVKLFRNFMTALGIDRDFLEKAKPCQTVLIWRDLFLQKCQSKEPGLALAALGLGTEFVVPDIYKFFLEAIQKHTSLTPEEYLFFELHVYADAEHGNDFVEILIDLAQENRFREAIRFGAISSLNLRNNFWDVMLARAL